MAAPGQRFDIDHPLLPDHGGDIAWAEQVFGVPAEGWLDLSTGINPWAYPLDAPDPKSWRHLPTNDRMHALVTAAKSFYGFADSAGLVAAPGTQALIQWLPRCFPSACVAILAPTYGEHGKAWYRAGHDVIEVAELRSVPAVADVVVVVNPNNPDGRLIEAEALKDLARALASKGGFVLVDEAFGDLDPSQSLAPSAGMPGLVVLKSFGKFFGLAGVRLGFAAGTGSLKTALEESLGPWAVSNPALEAGIQALEDTGWASAMRMRLASARKGLDEVLTGVGYPPVGGTDLYRLIACDDADALFRHLGGQGILTRIFSYEETWLRLGLPATDSELSRLKDGLASF